MAVQLTNCSLGVRSRAEGAVDAHGDRAPTVPGAVRGPWPGRKRELADGSWTLALDPAAWPVAERDLVVDPDTGQEWTVRTADLLTHSVEPVVDFVRVTAHERTADGHTEPAVGRWA